MPASMLMHVHQQRDPKPSILGIHSSMRVFGSMLLACHEEVYLYPQMETPDGDPRWDPDETPDGEVSRDPRNPIFG